MKSRIMGLFAVALLVVSTAWSHPAAARVLIASSQFGGAASGNSFSPSAPAGVGVYFGFSITDNGTCLGCDTNVGLGTFSNFTQSFTAQNSPNFANFVSQGIAGSTEPGYFVRVVLWTTNRFAANIPQGAPVFVNDAGTALLSLPAAPVINEVEVVVDDYCSGPSCTIFGQQFSNYLSGTLNVYAATSAVPEPSQFALFGVGLAVVGFARRRRAAQGIRPIDPAPASA